MRGTPTRVLRTRAFSTTRSRRPERSLSEIDGRRVLQTTRRAAARARRPVPERSKRRRARSLASSLDGHVACPGATVRPPSKSGYVVAVVLLLLVALAAAWKWTDLAEWADPDAITGRLEPLRARWYGLPIVVLVF